MKVIIEKNGINAHSVNDKAVISHGIPKAVEIPKNGAVRGVKIQIDVDFFVKLCYNIYSKAELTDKRGADIYAKHKTCFRFTQL